MIRISENIDLKEMTTFGIPAECGRLIEFDDYTRDLPELNRRGLLKDAFIIGGGSNLLLKSDLRHRTFLRPAPVDINGPRNLADFSQPCLTLTLPAGVRLDDACRLTAEAGFWKLVNLSGIPGTVGGAAVQNVGAYGVEFKDVVSYVTCYSPAEDRFLELSAEECRYGYRDSIFKHLPEGQELIVCSVTFRLEKHPEHPLNLSYRGLRVFLAGKLGLPADATAGEIEDALKAKDYFSPSCISGFIREMRDAKLPSPAKTGSAGSFFKNPVVNDAEFAEVTDRWRSLSGDPEATVPAHDVPAETPRMAEAHAKDEASAKDNASGKDETTVEKKRFHKLSAAWLIDHAGCKPLTVGGAALWPTQPLVLVNASGKATAADVLALEQMVIDKVKTTFGVSLSPEVIHV